jgi:hypothetical protein
MCMARHEDTIFAEPLKDTHSNPRQVDIPGPQHWHKQHTSPSHECNCCINELSQSAIVDAAAEFHRKSSGGL